MTIEGDTRNIDNTTRSERQKLADRANGHAFDDDLLPARKVAAEQASVVNEHASKTAGAARKHVRGEGDCKVIKESNDAISNNEKTE